MEDRYEIIIVVLQQERPLVLDVLPVNSHPLTFVSVLFSVVNDENLSFNREVSEFLYLNEGT